MPDKTLRLILGDQLDANHSWFSDKNENVTYVLAELSQETSYVKHHIQKLLAFFSSMQAFADALDSAGHQVIHLTLDDTAEFEWLPDLLNHLCSKNHFTKLQYQRPDEYRLSKQLREMSLDGVTVNRVESEHFFIPFDQLEDYFEPGKRMRMEAFYRKLRQRFELLMDGEEPLGGKWNYDTENRNKLKPADVEKIPPPLCFNNDIESVLERIKRHQVDHFGSHGEVLLWPVTRVQSLELLDHFCVHCLPHFGEFQDAMTGESESAWSLYHSRISYSLNAKIIRPLTVIERAISEFEKRPSEISLAQIEGFVRQILGWREFVRGIYWANMPSYANKNALSAQRPLPEYFWTAKTKMRCLQQSLGQSLQHAYAHHIQRLMVIGNFCLLAGINPDEVDAWYLGVYIDAIEWVEMPNTRGMSQFADNGLLASKPYAASGAYINRMSDYCGKCDYSVKERVGDKACPFNSLYWNFVHRHEEHLSSNARMSMVYRNWQRMDKKVKNDILAWGDTILASLEGL